MPSSAERHAAIYTLSLHDALPIYNQSGPLSATTDNCPTRPAFHIPQAARNQTRSEEHTSELQSLRHLVCRLLLSDTQRSTLFPYTTLFRSIIKAVHFRPPRIIVQRGRRFTFRKRRGTKLDRKSTRLNSSHLGISYAVFC